MRADRYVRDSIARLKAEKQGMGAGAPADWCRFVLMVLRPVIRKQLNWINVQGSDGSEKKSFTEGDLYAYCRAVYVSSYKFKHVTDTFIVP